MPHPNGCLKPHSQPQLQRRECSSEQKQWAQALILGCNRFGKNRSLEESRGVWRSLEEWQGEATSQPQTAPELGGRQQAPLLGEPSERAHRPQPGPWIRHSPQQCPLGAPGPWHTSQLPWPAGKDSTENNSLSLSAQDSTRLILHMADFMSSGNSTAQYSITQYLIVHFVVLQYNEGKGGAAAPHVSVSPGPQLSPTF